MARNWNQSTQRATQSQERSSVLNKSKVFQRWKVFTKLRNEKGNEHETMLHLTEISLVILRQYILKLLKVSMT